MQTGEGNERTEYLPLGHHQQSGMGVFKDERSNLFLIQTLFLQRGGLSQRLALISMESLKLSRVSGLATKWDAYSAAKTPLPDFPGVNPWQMSLKLTRLELG